MAVNNKKKKARKPKSRRRGKPKSRRGAKARRGNSARAAEQRLSHAINHPVRLDVMVILAERCASPNELADELDVPLGTTSFHVSELADVNAIELVKTEPRRGAVEHYYRAKTLPEVSDEEWRAMSKAAKRQSAAIYLTPVLSESLASLGNGNMDADDDLYVFWSPAHLSAAGQEALHELHAEFQERLEALIAEDEANATDSDPVRFVAMLGFERSRRGSATGRALGRTKS